MSLIDMITDIERLNKRYANEIREMESALEALRTKLAMIEEVDKEARTMESEPDTGKFAGMGLTEAILEAVKDFGKKGGTAGQIHKYIIGNGFKSASENLAVSVIGTLKR